jgi:prepilin-type processing-associated H-X9-DG protein
MVMYRDDAILLNLAKKIVAEAMDDEKELLGFTRTYYFPRQDNHTLWLDGHVTLTDEEAELLQRLGVTNEER